MRYVPGDPSIDLKSYCTTQDFDARTDLLPRTITTGFICSIQLETKLCYN